MRRCQLKPFLDLLASLLFQMRQILLQGMGYPHEDSLSQRKFQGQQLDRTGFLPSSLCIQDAQSGLLRDNNSLQQCALKAHGSGIKEARIRHVVLLRS